MKVITITSDGWISCLPKIQRPVELNRIGRIAAEKGWVVRAESEPVRDLP